MSPLPRLGQSHPDDTSGCFGGAAGTAFGPDLFRPPGRSAGHEREILPRRARREVQHHPAGRGFQFDRRFDYTHPADAFDLLQQHGVGEQQTLGFRNSSVTDRLPAARVSAAVREP